MRKLFIIIISFIGLFNINNLQAQDSTSTSQIIEDVIPVTVATIPSIKLKSIKVVNAGDGILFQSEGANGKSRVNVNGESTELVFKDGYANPDWDVDETGSLKYISYGEGKNKQHDLYHTSIKNGINRIKNIPLWLSIVPPLLAIFLALLFKEVNVSLFAGIWSGAFIAGGLRLDGIYYIFKSFVNVLEKYIIEALSDSGHLSVILFSLLIGGMVAIISKNGGMAGVVMSLSKYARSPVSSQFITWLLGLAIFFDDYANTLIVGNTMRSVTDKFKISREKLAYIVDSTAAPVAAVAFITTWIGAELDRKSVV